MAAKLVAVVVSYNKPNVLPVCELNVTENWPYNWKVETEDSILKITSAVISKWGSLKNTVVIDMADFPHSKCILMTWSTHKVVFFANCTHGGNEVASLIYLGEHLFGTLRTKEFSSDFIKTSFEEFSGGVSMVKNAVYLNKQLSSKDIEMILSGTLKSKKNWQGCSVM